MMLCFIRAPLMGHVAFGIAMYPWTMLGFVIGRRLGIRSTMMLLTMWFVSVVEMPVWACGFVQNIAIDDCLVLVVVAADPGSHAVPIEMVNVILVDVILFSGTRNIDSVTIAHGFHHVVDFVPGHDIFAAVHVFFSGLPPFPVHGIRTAGSAGNLSYAGKLTSRAEGSVRLASPARPAADRDARVGRVVDQVVSHPVFAALPHHDCRRSPVDLSNVMDPVVRHVVALIDSFVPGP